MYCHLSFSERENGKWPLGLSDFYHNYIMGKGYIQHFRKIFIRKTELKQYIVT